jgi:hypothetical protein
MKKNQLSFSILMLSLCFISAKTFSQEAPGDWSNGAELTGPDPVTAAKLTNYPNPVINRTSIQYQVPAESKVLVKLYNNSGQLISVLFAGINKAGSYEIELNAAGMAGGIYICALSVTTANKTSHLIRKIKIAK